MFKPLKRQRDQKRRTVTGQRPSCRGRLVPRVRYRTAISIFAGLAAVGIFGSAVLAEEKSQRTTLELQLQPENARPFAGARFNLNFVAGSVEAPVDSLFGIAFELHYADPTWIEFEPDVQPLAGALLQPDVITFARHEPENRVIFLAASRKRGAAGSQGAGTVLSVPIRIREDAPPGTQVCFTVRNVTANDPDGISLAATAGPEVCLEITEPAIRVVPNPFTPNGDGFNDFTEFQREGGLPADWQVQIMDRSGRILQTLTGGASRWDGRDSEGREQLPGAYLYTIRDGERLVRRGLLTLIR